MVTSEHGEVFKVEPSSIEVYEDDWKTSAGGFLMTRTASPCAVVAATIPAEKTGFLGHFQTIYLRRNEKFKEFIEAIEEEAKDSDLEFWLGGAAMIDSPRFPKEASVIQNQEVLYDRSVLEQTVKALGKTAVVQPNWLGFNQEIVVAELNCKGNRLQYAIRNIPLGSR